MRQHVISILTGLALAVVGIVLWLTAGNVDTPVVTLTKVGVVLMVVGGIEVAWSACALAFARPRKIDAGRTPG